MLPCLNSDIDGDDIYIQNVVKKYCNLTEKISKMPEIFANGLN
jgi:hypothetical protein